MDDNAPRIAVELIGSKRESRPGQWSFTWRIANFTDQPLQFLAARCPHGEFKSEQRRFNPGLHAGAGEQVQIEMTVRCDAPAGSVVENGFLILFAQWQRASWRIFVRLRVAVDQKGQPAPLTESITTQRAGFSGVGEL